MVRILDAKMSQQGVSAINADNIEEDKESMAATNDIKGRLRNYSYKEATNTPTKGNYQRSAKTLSICEEAEDIDEDSELGSLEEIVIPNMLKKEEWQGKGTTHKLDAVFDSINKLYNIYHRVNSRLKPIEMAVFHKEDGMLPQMAQIVEHAKTVDQRLTNITEENIKLRDELEIVKGLVHKQSKQISTLQSKLADQVARSMENNVTIAGILGDKPKVDTDELKAQVTNFLEESMEVDLEDDSEISQVRRLGAYVKDKHRPIVVTVTQQLQKKIFENTTKLKNKFNALDQPFSVNRQLPDLLAKKRREVRQIVKDKRAQEKGLNDSQKSAILVRNSKVFINGQLQRKVLIPPKPMDLFPEAEEQDKMDNIKLVFSKPASAEKCTFKAVACVAPRLNDVHLAYKKMFQLFPAADHIIAAFSSEHTAGFQDDSEFGSGHRILKSIVASKLTEVAVFVVRDYGGEHLGPSRFKVMQQVAEEALYKLS